MAKRRHGAKDEILVVPFLDILCSLIGVLVLIIVILCVSQSQQTQGRTQEEVKMAQEHLKMQREMEQRKKDEVLVKDQMAKMQTLMTEKKDKNERFLRLRNLLASSGDAQEQNKREALLLQKELSDLMTEIVGLKKQEDESKKEVAALLAELEKLKIPKDKEVPPVVVQPSGSGMADTTKVFFVECGGGSLKIINAWGDNVEYRLAATAEVVDADQSYDHFLAEVKKDPNSLILFLIRDDGQGAFNNGAGLASMAEIRIGKIPIPGRGKLDLAMFEKYRGKIPPPAPATPAAAPATTTTTTS